MCSRRPIFTRLVTLLLLLTPLFGHAQLSGLNTKGDFGMQAGTQPPPGFYIVPLYLDYSADNFKGGDGNNYPGIDGGGSVDAKAAVAGLMWVSEKKILGGTYSFSIWPGVTNNALEFPPLGVDGKVSNGLADLYIQPISLGWSRERADFVAGLGIYAPTGEYESGGNSNRGLGMWGYEIFGGTTVYFDESRSWHASALAAFETHSEKDGTDIKVGDLLTIEGGIGKSFMDGALSVGIAYYGQWKLNDDDFGLGISLPGNRGGINRHRVFGWGPEVTLPIATKKKLYGFLNLRYFRETGAHTSLEGDTLLLTLSFPVPSIPLQ